MDREKFKNTGLIVWIVMIIIFSGGAVLVILAPLLILGLILRYFFSLEKQEERKEKKKKQQEEFIKNRQLYEEKEEKLKFEKYQELRKAIEQMPKYKKWREDVFQKNGRKCEICGKKENLEIHHRTSFYSIIKTYSIDDIYKAFECDALWDIDNGSVVCKFCHEKTQSHQYRNRN